MSNFNLDKFGHVTNSLSEAVQVFYYVIVVISD